MIQAIPVDQISTEPLSIENALHLWIRNIGCSLSMFLHFYSDVVTCQVKVKNRGYEYRYLSHEKGIAIAAKAVESGMIVEVLQ